MSAKEPAVAVGKKRKVCESTDVISACVGLRLLSREGEIRREFKVGRSTGLCACPVKTNLSDTYWRINCPRTSEGGKELFACECPQWLKNRVSICAPLVSQLRQAIIAINSNEQSDLLPFTIRWGSGRGEWSKPVNTRMALSNHSFKEAILGRIASTVVDLTSEDPPKVSQINGANGEATGSDDLDADELERIRRSNRRLFYARDGQARASQPRTEAQRMREINNAEANRLRNRQIAERLHQPDTPRPRTAMQALAMQWDEDEEAGNEEPEPENHPRPWFLDELPDWIRVVNPGAEDHPELFPLVAVYPERVGGVPDQDNPLRAWDLERGRRRPVRGEAAYPVLRLRYWDMRPVAHHDDFEIPPLEEEPEESVPDEVVVQPPNLGGFLRAAREADGGSVMSEMTDVIGFSDEEDSQAQTADLAEPPRINWRRYLREEGLVGLPPLRGAHNFFEPIEAEDPPRNRRFNFFDDDQEVMGRAGLAQVVNRHAGARRRNVPQFAVEAWDAHLNFLFEDPGIPGYYPGRGGGGGGPPPPPPFIGPVLPPVGDEPEIRMDPDEGSVVSKDRDGDMEREILLLCGTNGYFQVGSVVYKMFGGVMLPYNRETCQWAGQVFVEPFRVVNHGQVLVNFSGAPGVYRLTEGVITIAESPFSVVRDFVILARDHRWFKQVRERLAAFGSDAMTVATLGYFDLWPEGPYRFRTKQYKDIMISREMYTYLQANKIASGVTPDQVVLLSRIAFRDFPYLPIEVLIETLLYFTYQRGAALSEMSATTGAITSYLQAGKTFKVYREPWNVNAVVGDLIAGVGDITDEGWYRINSDTEVNMWARKGFTSIARLHYVPSADEHGDGDNPLMEPGEKFELFNKYGFNQGCGFNDPYPIFNTMSDDRPISKSYQTVGSAFATGMMVIDGKLPREVARCFLRLSKARPNEEYLRAVQMELVRPALAAGRVLAGQVDADITAKILRNDPKYEPDKLMGPFLPNTPFQNLVRDAHLNSQAQLLDPALLVRILADPIVAAEDYTRMIAGPKMNKRLRDIEAYRRDPSVSPQATNMVKFKPDEGQKYKLVAGKPILKFGRATISIEGLDWVLANPPMMYAMKHVLEHVVTITRRPGGSVIECNGVRTLTTTQLDYDLWYRAVLSDTSNEDLALVDQAMLDWVNAAPNRMAAITHGDDIYIIKSDDVGRVSSIEADVSDNDGSFTDSMLRLEAQVVAVNCDPSDCFAQQANPLQLVNPANAREKVLLRSTRGMLRCSGSIDTTFGNTRGSYHVVLSIAYQSKRLAVDLCANAVGFNVTYKEVSVTEACFLSTFVYYKQVDGVRVPCRAKCLASIARNFGRFCGDLPGSKNRKVSDRWRDYVKGVIKGYVGEPDSMFMRALRVKHDGWALGSICSWAFSKWEPSCVDLGIVRHYYSPHEIDQGLEEYLACVRLIRESPDFGVVVACRFIDRIMSVRYGMAPIIPLR